MPAQDETTLRKQIDALRSELAELRSLLASSHDQGEPVRSQRDRLQAELGHLRENLDRANANLLALKESESRYRILSGASLAGVYVIDYQGKIVYANPQVAQMLGYTPDEVIGFGVLDIVAPESRALVEENVRRRLQDEVTSIQYSARVLHRDGSILDWEIFGHRTVFDGKPAIVGTVLDRTEAKRAERALRASEARFQAFMEHTPALAFMKDAESRFVYANHAFYKMLGYPEGGILGKTPHDLFPREQADEMVASDRKIVSTGQAFEVTQLVRFPNGESRQLFALKFPVDDSDGRCLVGGTAFDITELKNAEEALAGQKRILQSILDSMGEGVAATNEKGEFIIFNPAARRITGLGPLGTTPQEWTETYGVLMADGDTPCPPEDLPLARALRGESTDNVELLIRNPQKQDGAWVTTTGRPLVDEAGNPCGGVVVFRDTTERRKTLQKLTHAEAKYRALVEQLPVVTYISGVEPLGPTLFISPQIEGLVGCTPQEWIGSPHIWLDHIHPDDRARVMAEVQHATETGERFVCEYRLQHRDGSLKWVHDEAVLVRDSEGRPLQKQGVVLDITERERERGMRQRLQALSKELVSVQEAERRRIGLELHDEIGQLLTGIKMKLGVGDRLAPEEQDARLREADQLVDETIARVRELSQNLRPAALDDLGLLPALVSYFGRYSRQTGVLVQLEHRGVERRRFDPEVETAGFRIVQEALTNVARHARVRSVQVRAWADEQMLGVQIEDEGPGFDSEAAVANGNTQGLVGMRERAALLRGVLTVEAAPGRGCRVTCELPIADGAGCKRKDDA